MSTDTGTNQERSTTRIGDAERNRTADLLGSHLAAGRLTTEEFQDRLAAVFAAKTAGELDAQISDLPDLSADTHPPETPERRPETSGPAPEAPALHPVERRETTVIHLRQALAATLPLGGIAATIGIVLAYLTGPANAGDYGDLAAVVLAIAGGLLCASTIVWGQLWALTGRISPAQRLDQKRAGSR